MRVAVGFLVAAAVGIHCSAPAESPGTSAPELAGVEAPAPSPGHGSEPQPAQAPLSAEPKEPDPLALATPDVSVFLRDAETTRVTSTIVDSTSGATYAAGTFLNHVVIGGTLLESRGDKDVFVLKIDANSGFEWVRAVGSAYADTEPRLSLEGTKVNVIGMTEGAMDCGKGPLPTWSSATFFFCVFGATDGTSLSGGVFPTGTP